MRCPACGGEYQPGDRFCGTCGERLPGDGESGGAPQVASGPSAAAAPAMASAPAAAPPPVAGPACPVCGSALPAEAARCGVCGFEPGASVVLPGSVVSQAAAPARSPAEASSRVCPIHGPLDPSWTRCPYCLREGREGRLASGPVGMAGGPEARPAPAAPPAPVQSSAAVPSASAPAAPPQPAVVAGPPSVPAQAEPVTPAPAPPPVPAPAAPPPGEGGVPRSSVGATFVVRRRPRVLAYLIEREGEAVGRVHQLDDDVTDIGRDPRNHIVLSDVLVSGFHARIERGPDGGFIAEDRQSTNGSFLNDEPLTGARPFAENDALRVGNTTLVLKVVS